MEKKLDLTVRDSTQTLKDLLINYSCQDLHILKLFHASNMVVRQLLFIYKFTHKSCKFWVSQNLLFDIVTDIL